MEKKEAIKILKDFHDESALFSIRTALETLYPEFKESEEGKIRKGLIKYFKNFDSESLYTVGLTEEEILAWLEKQGESYTKRDVDDAWLKGMCDAKRELEKQKDTNVFDVPKISIKDAIDVTSRMQYIEDDMKPIADFVIDYASWNLHKDEWNQPTLTVPLFRVLDALIQRGKPYCECSQNIEKQGEQKPIIDGILTATNYDKMFQNCNVPKFNVGDWVVYYRNDSSREIIQVYDIRDGRYYFTDNVHFSWSVKECDERCHLWTIQDAKGGDVLYCENSGIEYIVMNKGINKCNNIDSYFRYNSEDGFDIGVPSVLSAEEDIIIPATKEQRDFLFKKMKEAGYKWVADKKELKKISQRMISAEAKEAMYDKPACAWSEEDEKIMKGIKSVLEHYKDSGEVVCPYPFVKIEEALAWLEKQGEQKPAWSEVDDYMLESIISDFAAGHKSSIGQDKWLKSLKQRIGG